MAQLDVTEMVPTKFAPKMKRLFYFAIEGIDAFLVKTAKRPSREAEEVPLNWLNSTRYIAGKSVWGELSVTLIDALDPSASQQVMEWLRSCSESITGRDGYPEFYKRDIQIRILDYVGNVVELWDIKGAFVKTADFGELSYEDGAAVQEITLGIRFDNCVLNY